MGNNHRLRELESVRLVEDLAEIVRKSNTLTAELLAHLLELEERRLHLELGFSSLFAYCVERLGMSEGTAGRRVAAARVCRRFPDALDRVARGELHLCALCALAPHLSVENSGELFAACHRKTRRQIDELLAVRFPRPDVRAQIRRLPTPRAGARDAAGAAAPSREMKGCPPLPSFASEGKINDCDVMPETSRIPAASAPAPETQHPRPSAQSPARARRRELEPLSGERFGVHFTADAELRDLIERARALASHRLAKGDLPSLMKLMATSFVRQEEKRRFGIGARPRRANVKNSTSISDRATPPGGVGKPRTPSDGTAAGNEAKSATAKRYLAVAVRRGAYMRDDGQCAFLSADGRRCSARASLEFDHVDPHARRGSDELPNIRVLCKAHNLLHARHCFGALHVAAKIAARRRQALEREQKRPRDGEGLEAPGYSDRPNDEEAL